MMSPLMRVGLVIIAIGGGFLVWSHFHPEAPLPSTELLPGPTWSPPPGDIRSHLKMPHNRRLNRDGNAFQSLALKAAGIIAVLGDWGGDGGCSPAPGEVSVRTGILVHPPA